MNLHNILSLNFWFDMAPGSWDVLGRWIIIVVLISLVLGFLFKILAVFQKNKPLLEPLFQQFGTIGLFFGLTGAFFWIVRQQQMPIFSARFWWLILIVVTFVWKYKVLVSAKKYKENKQKYAERQQVYDKYLP